MKLEISHDSLAKHIYEKASADDKMRKKISDFITTRYKFYQDNKSLLRSDDLHYVEPYLNEIELPQEQDDFVKKSQELETRQRWLWIGGTIAIVLLLTALAGIAFWGWNSSAIHEDQLMASAAELKTEQKENHSLIHKLRSTNKQLKETKEENQRLADSLAAQGGVPVNIDSLSDGQKKAMILTLIGNRKDLEEEKEVMQTRYVEDIEKERNEIAKQKEREKLKEIKLAKENEAKRVQQLLERKYNQLIQQKELELRRAKSLALSAKALTAFERNELKTAFELASESFKLDKKNKEAIEVLQKIAKKKADVFGQKYGPTLSDPEQIIKRLDKTYKRNSSAIIQRKYFKQR